MMIALALGARLCNIMMAKRTTSTRVATVVNVFPPIGETGGDACGVTGSTTGGAIAPEMSRYMTTQRRKHTCFEHLSWRRGMCDPISVTEVYLL